MSEDTYHSEVGIIGGGVAGLGAGITASYRGLSNTVFEGGALGGIVSTLYPHKVVENYPGTPSILGRRLIDEFVIQAREEQVEIRQERVINVRPDKTIVTNEGTYKFKTIIIATGSQPAELGIPGERKFKRNDKGVYHFVTDPKKFKRKQVLVVGGGDTALDAVLELHGTAEKVYIVHRRDRFRGAESKVKEIRKKDMAELVMDSELVRLEGDKELERAVIKNKKTQLEEEVEIDRCILAVGMKTNLEIFSDLGLQIEGKYIKVDRKMRTNVEGFFAVGDVVSRYQLIVIAVAQGAIAAHHAYEMIRNPYWAEEEPWPTEIE